MYQRSRPRRFRRRSNGRGHLSHINGQGHSRMRPNSFSNDQNRNNFRTTQSAEKLLEKYNNLAKEAISTGDKTLGENYLQHADHFLRIIEDKNKMREQNKVNNVQKSTTEDKFSSANKEIKQEETIKNKE